MAAPINLVTLRPGLVLNQLAAQSWARMERDHGRQIDVNSSYRNWDLQARWHQESLDYNAGRIKYPGHAYAVDPRYSEHCLANAVDTDDWNKPGFLAFAATHGWIQTDKSRGEEHHLAYRADRDKHRDETAPAGTRITPIPATPNKPKEDDFVKILRTNVPNGTEYLFSEALSLKGYLVPLNGPQSSALQAAGVTVYVLALAEIQAIESALRLLARPLSRDETQAAVWETTGGTLGMHAPAGRILAASANETEARDRHTAVLAALAKLA